MNEWIPRTDMPRRSLVGLVSDVWRDSAQLIREEIELAKTELTEKVAQARNGVASVVVGGMISIIGLIFVLWSVVQLLAYLLPEQQAPWLSPLIVGGCVMLAGLGSVYAGIRQLRAAPPPLAQARRSVQQDAQLVKEHIP